MLTRNNQSSAKKLISPKHENQDDTSRKSVQFEGKVEYDEQEAIFDILKSSK